MTGNATSRRDRVVEVMAEILEIETNAIKLGDRLREDLGMDSLASLELLSTISEELILDLEMEEAMDIRTVSDACDFVEKNFVAQHAGQSAHA